MATAYNSVLPLSGEEIILDILEQIAEKLRRDCNLREVDGYSGGYSAKISLSIRCYGMDVAEINTEVAIGTEQPDPDDVIDTKLEIALEPALDIVRERSGQEPPDISQKPDAPVTAPPKRRYTKRADLHKPMPQGF